MYTLHALGPMYGQEGHLQNDIQYVVHIAGNPLQMPKTGANCDKVYANKILK